jgi:hypothetical protein
MPVLEFMSHIEGKNAKVRVYPDRIEWDRARGISGGKITAGILTGGLSVLATGVKNGKAASDMIPMKHVTGVTTQRDGLINSKVIVITSGNQIAFRVSHADAAKVKEVLSRLILAA